MSATAKRPATRLFLFVAPGLVIGALVLLAPCLARAQASSFLYVGGGSGMLDRGETETQPLIQVDAGLGTSSRSPVVVGGLFRAQGYLGRGMDLGIVSRIVSSGFARGDYGVGVDLGVAQRWWGETATGFSGSVVLGGPWGLTLNLGATLAAREQRTLFASLGVDLARLTVHRHTGLSWMPNPMRSPADD
jgi:hypothetical protein